MPYHGEIIAPEQEWLTYAYQMLVSDEVLYQGEQTDAERAFLANAEARARASARDIDPHMPIDLTFGDIQRERRPAGELWNIRIYVRCLRYVYRENY